MVFAFQHRFAEAINTFSEGLVVAKSKRKATQGSSRVRKGAKGKKNKQHVEIQPDENDSPNHANGSIPAIDEAAEIGLTPGDDVERQLFFLRGMSYFNWASQSLEDVVLRLEGVGRPKEGPLNEGGEATLEGLGIRNAQVHGLLGASRSKSSARLTRYEQALSEAGVRDSVFSLLHRSAKDHERFLSYFPVFKPDTGFSLSTIEKRPNLYPKPRKEDKLSPHARRMIQHRSLEGRTRQSHPEAGSRKEECPLLLTTYHPLM